MIKYLKQLKQAAVFGGLILFLSFLRDWRIDSYDWLASVSSFLILAIHDAGKPYLDLTQQPATKKHVFGVIVNPLLAVICLSSIFYVLAGEMNWLFWLVALFIGFILFVVDAVPLVETVKKP